MEIQKLLCSKILLRSAVELLFNQLSAPQDNPYRTSNEWNNQVILQFVKKRFTMVLHDKLRDLRERTIGPASHSLTLFLYNRSDGKQLAMFQDMQLRLEMEDISFLLMNFNKTLYALIKKNIGLIKKKRWMNREVQTMLMDKRSSKLTPSLHNGLLKLEEHGRGSYKDKIVATCYFKRIGVPN